MKQVRICLGRFQPFTLGHLKMATYKCKGPQTISGFKGPIKQEDLLREQPDIKEINKQKTLILCVKVDESEVDKRHPFPKSLMKEEMDLVKSYPEIEDVLFVDSADICTWGELIKQKGYQASVWLTGSDEEKPYVEMTMKVPEYEEHNRDNRDCKGAYTKSFYVESIERIDDGDFISSISGTKVREALLNDDKEYFKKAMPKGCDKLFDKFKEALENPNLPDVYKKPKQKKLKEYLNDNIKPILEFVVKHKVNQYSLDDYCIIRPYYGLYQLLKDENRTYLNKHLVEKPGNSWYIYKICDLIDIIKKHLPNEKPVAYQDVFLAPEGVNNVNGLKQWLDEFHNDYIHPEDIRRGNLLVEIDLSNYIK